MNALHKCLSYLLFIAIIILSSGSHIYARHFKDTVGFKRAVAEKHPITLTDSALNEIGIDSLLNKVEFVHNTLNQINNTIGIGFNTRSIEETLPEIDSNIDIIDDNLSLYNSVLDVKNLQMFNVLLADLQGQLADDRALLFKYYKELDGMSDQMTTFKKDTVLRALLADTAFRALYLNEINDLRTKWKLAKKTIGENMTRINQLQANVSNQYFETIDLQNKINDLMRKISGRTLGKEYAYLWDLRGKSVTADNKNSELVHKSYVGQRKILHYYFRRNWDDRLEMILTGLTFFTWILVNFIKLGRAKNRDKTGESPFKYIRKFSIVATLVVLFNIAPFFDIHPPTPYVEMIEFLLVISLTILLWRTWPKQLFFYWLSIGILYIAFSFTGALLTPSLGFRVLLLALNGASIIFGILWFRILKKHTLTFAGMIRIVSVIYIVLNLAAVVCNISGRLSLAKIFSVTAIFGLTQVIGLSVFIHIVVESFRLQAMVTKLKGGFSANINFTKIESLLSGALMIISVCIWTIVFSISLNIYSTLFTTISTFLSTSRKIGNTSFQVGNILLFICIIYISNLLQQGIGSLYGKSDGAWDPEVKKNGSRLAMTRLILIIIGFLIAVAASGIPMDKITIVLGALGVGIGLGLQSIVNNLVSGVILIFEQPFRIGDFIEVGESKGRVLDIGIRSSKLVMDEGAEVIMPNADLLSGRVINWTLRNDNVRIELKMAIDTAHPFDDVAAIIMEELNKNEHVIKTTPPEILLTSQSDKAMNLNIQIWIDDVHKLQSIKSALLNAIYGNFARTGIRVV